MQRDGSEEVAVERLNLGRDVAANRSSSDAPPHRPPVPVPNGGASATPSNWSCFRNDRRDRTTRVGENIVAELAGGNVQEAFHHLKGWYRAASETQSKPCYHTMERQTSERVDLYARRQSPGDPLPLHLTPVEIDDDVPMDSEIRIVAGGLTNGRAGGASGMCAEHVKAWLRGVLEEEDPESQGNFAGHGDNWKLFVELVQAVGPMASSPVRCFGA